MASWLRPSKTFLSETVTTVVIANWLKRQEEDLSSPFNVGGWLLLTSIIDISVLLSPLVKKFNPLGNHQSKHKHLYTLDLVLTCQQLITI